MDKETERVLRTLALIFLSALIPLGTATVLSASGATLYGRVGLLVTLAGVSFAVYTHYFEAPEDNPKAIDYEEMSNSKSAGVRPDRTAPEFEINDEDRESAQLSPEEVARSIMSSPNWHPDGDGGYPTLIRPRLRKLFLSDMFSNKWFETTLFILTVSSFTSIMIIGLSGLTINSSWILQTLSNIYPELSPTADTIVFVLSASISVSGFSYFAIKSRSTCPVCENPFSLRTHKRHFKPQHRDVETRIENEEKTTYEVKHGVHIFSCEQCGSWSIFPERWEREL